METNSAHGQEKDRSDLGRPAKAPGRQGVSPLRRRIMQSNRRRDTGAERQVRSALHQCGLRFRVDRPIRVEGVRPIRPDIVFPTLSIAIFVDGCFWHGCPEHGTLPATNRDYWLPKIAENQSRDRRNTAALEADGWTVVRVWEHEDPTAVAERVSRLVDRHRREDRPTP